MYFEFGFGELLTKNEELFFVGEVTARIEIVMAETVLMKLD